MNWRRSTGGWVKKIAELVLRRLGVGEQPQGFGMRKRRGARKAGFPPHSIWRTDSSGAGLGEGGDGVDDELLESRDNDDEPRRSVDGALTEP